MSKAWGAHIRNNGISLRRCRKVLIENCVVENCRSGGIVAAFCNDLIIRHCVLRGNYFDGIALFQCQRVIIENCIIEDNGYSGVSIDDYNRLSSHIRIRHCTIKHNGDWAIWARRGKHIRHDIDKRVVKV